MSLKLIIKDLGPIWDHRKIDTKKMAVFGHFFRVYSPVFDTFLRLNLPLTPSFVGSNPATPATGAIYCVIL